jgi:hypothetical protein
MFDYKLNGKLYELTLENGKVVKVDKTWVDNAEKVFETNTTNALRIWLEDNDYLVNEELEELDTQAKINKPKNVVKSTTERKKVVRERKPNETKRDIINILQSAIAENLDPSATVENIEKIIVFHVNGQEFKVNLTQTRQKKSE